jgi:PadR family transcriptional regulator, regulatory protein PadR
MPSAQTISVLAALAADPLQWRYGYDLGAELNLKSGSLYPILIRLADRGLLEADWKQGPAGTPARHVYRLTQAGRDAASALAIAEPAGRAPAARRVQLGGA